MKALLKITANKSRGMDIEVHGTMPDIMTTLTIACEGVMREVTNNESERKQLKRAFIQALKATDIREFEKGVTIR